MIGLQILGVRGKSSESGIPWQSMRLWLARTCLSSEPRRAAARLDGVPPFAPSTGGRRVPLQAAKEPPAAKVGLRIREEKQAAYTCSAHRAPRARHVTVERSLVAPAIYERSFSSDDCVLVSCFGERRPPRHPFVCSCPRRTQAKKASQSRQKAAPEKCDSSDLVGARNKGVA